MRVRRKFVEDLVFGTQGGRRYTQDSPVLPDVWIRYGDRPAKRIDLLLTPHKEATAGALGHALRRRLDGAGSGVEGRSPHRISSTETTVAASLTLEEMIRSLLPLTRWWTEYVEPVFRRRSDTRYEDASEHLVETLARSIRELDSRAGTVGAHPGLPSRGDAPPELSAPFVWLVQIVGVLVLARELEPAEPDREARAGIGSWKDLERALETSPEAGTERTWQEEAVAEAALDLLVTADPPGAGEERLAWLASLNRPVETAVTRSVRAVKADAALRVFDVSCENIAWAVIDSGIDATHPAFRRWDEAGVPYPEAFEKSDSGEWINRTRVEATYDFTRVRDLLDPSAIESGELPKPLADAVDRQDEKATRIKEILEDLRRRLLVGRDVDWGMLAPLLRVEHDESYADHLAGDHGTHVAGIIGADWREGNDAGDGEGREVLRGVCPDIRLYDFRVLDPSGGGDEFAVIAALQFARHLNSRSDHVVLHGANISLSIPHDVANYACGRTPVCEECDRASARGMCVVAAAGNQGYQRYQTARGFREGYHSISITDPGNAEAVLTVGSTHRFQPHTYGVSYFSSRGPTGDGRNKPDLVAPGEKIVSTVPGDTSDRMDGTSMAAPHVSGAAALLMARHMELMGRPGMIKDTLCSTATDLGREPYFQGAGMLDALRALQAV